MKFVVLIFVVFLPVLHGQFTWMTPYDTSNFTDWAKVLRNVPAQCSLKHVHVVARHGSRTPSSGQIVDAVNASAKLARLFHGKSSLPLINEIIDWRPHFPDGGENLLPRGADEQRFLAKDYYHLFEMYNLTGTVLFGSSSTSRAIESSKAFRQSWQMLSSASVLPFTVLPNIVDDDRLSFFTTCDKYVYEIKNNESTRPEFTGIPKSPEAVKLVKEFNQRLYNSANANLTLNFAEISSLYYMLGYEMMTNGSSRLSKLFTQSDLEFFDYADDVETYWKQSYGYDLNYQAACDLIKFIVGLSPVVRSLHGGTKAGFAGIFQFGHSETLVPLYSAFGLFKDQRPLTANATRDFIKNRKFKGSEITPFSANIAFLFFDCPSKNSDPNADSDILVAVTVNGKLVRLAEACPKTDACPVPAINETYSSVIQCVESSICYRPLRYFSPNGKWMIAGAETLLPPMTLMFVIFLLTVLHQLKIQ